MSSFKKQFAKHRAIIGVVVLSVVATVLLIYLTPLKFITIVPPPMNEMDPTDFYAVFQAHPDDYIFIDVRSPNIYQAAHAKGAINVPIENLFDEHYTLPKTGKKIALICTTGRLAAIAYGYLQDWGFNNLIHIEGGLQNWTGENLPVEGRNVYAPLPTSTDDQHQ